MATELDSRVICTKCGISYGRRKGNFPASYAILHKGIGYVPICRTCVESLYEKYLAACGNDSKMAVRQMCRKLDLYWDEAAFESVSKKNTTRSLMTGYMQRLNTVNLIGKCYDDTLIKEGTMWSFGNTDTPAKPAAVSQPKTEEQKQTEEEAQIADEVIAFWGSGYTPAMYRELEERLQYWKSKLPDGTVIDIGTEALLRQIIFLEIDINRDRAQGKSVDKNMNTLNTLLGSAMLKPAQKKDEAADAALENTPLGVWLYRYENKRPLPTVDDDLKDVNGILKYVFIWLGHVCKMLGKKNGFSRLYEKEIARYRVERPEFDDEDDEEFLSDVLDEEDELDGDVL